jgi:hypothetical protein
LFGKSEGKRPFGRPRCKWGNNIRMDKQMGWEVVDWIHLMRDVGFTRRWRLKSKFLGCNIELCCGRISTFRRALLPPSSGSEDLGLDSPGWGKGPMTSSCEHGNEPSGSVKGGEFLDYLRTVLRGQRWKEFNSTENQHLYILGFRLLARNTM